MINLKQMKRYFFAAGLSLLLVAGSGCVGNANRADKTEESDRAAIERLVGRYIESINTCDTTIVNDIWSHADHVTFIAPSGYYKTYNEIRDSLVVGLFGNVFTERHLQRDQLKLSVNENSAWAEFAWTFSAVRKDGAPHNTKGLETQVFEKDSAGVWHLVHIHYSAAQ